MVGINIAACTCRYVKTVPQIYIVVDRQVSIAQHTMLYCWDTHIHAVPLCYYVISSWFICRFGSWNVVVRELNIHVLMRDEKEGRKKHARSNKQGKATQYMYIHVKVYQTQIVHKMCPAVGGQTDLHLVLHQIGWLLRVLL